VGSSKPKKTPYLLFSTASNLKEAKKIAKRLIERKLAACVNIIPNLKSYFRWQGKFDQANELLLVIKTDKRLLKKVETAICELHSYTIPEVIGWQINWGSKPYFDWLTKSTS